MTKVRCTKKGDFMRTYYIVSHFNEDNREYWQAHKRGFNSVFNNFGIMNTVIGSASFTSADCCESRLRNIVKPVKPKIVRVVHI